MKHSLAVLMAVIPPILWGSTYLVTTEFPPSVSLVVQLAISPEFNQFGAAWEHLCHAIPKNAKPLC